MSKAHKKITEAPDESHVDFKFGAEQGRILQTLGRPGVEFITPEVTLTATTSQAQLHAGIAAGRASLIHVDRGRYTVSYDGRIGTIGNTDSLALLACLVDRVHQPVNHETLLRAIGGKQVELKGKIRNLKVRLEKIDFADLAKAIKHGTGYYKLTPK